METCVYPSCTDLGVMQGQVTSTDGTTATGWLCFPHAFPSPADVDIASTVVHTEDGYDPIAEMVAVELAEPTETFYPEVAAGLAAMAMEHAAMAMLDRDDAATSAMTSLASNTLFGNDVAAGVILALTAVAAAGGVTGGQLMELAEQYERLADNDEPAPNADGRFMAAASVLDAVADEVAEGV